MILEGMFVVQGLNAPGRVSHGKQALWMGSDTFMRTNTTRHMMSPGMAEPGCHPGARLGVGTHYRAPGYLSWDLASPRPNKRREVIPQWAHHLQGEPCGTVLRGLGSR
ncbi:hypothetical protein ILYODFUR_018433 [Ilyodon furcidens]|uniref:Uncharacterized protein n=1 Tax=Ilyodon furcidens TaxID=33524 RepID=A0ABV0SQR9_9TELE